MKLRLLALACAVAAATVAETVSFKVTMDRPDCVYRCGDEAVFTVSVLDAKGAPAKAGSLEATIDNFGERKVAEK